MKIKGVIDSTGVSRQTIHFYLREGLLPKPRKMNLNQAEYDQGHIERLRLIKELRERFFLPLSVIKEIIGHMKDFNRNDSMLRVKAENFTPLAQFLPERVGSEEAFLEETGLSAQRLAHFEEFGIITPIVINGQKVYSQDDVSIGKVLGTMRRVGFSVERGFPKDLLRTTKQKFEQLVFDFNKIFVETGLEIMTAKELDSLKKPATELMAVFFYHIYRRLGREDLNQRILQRSAQVPKKGKLARRSGGTE